MAPQTGVQLIEVSGLRLAYRREGQGPPVVLLHGFFGDHRVWRDQFDLADDYTIVAWDAPGCGSSSPPPRTTWRMTDYADCLAGFIEALGLEQPHIVGNSFGGTLAAQLSIRHPDCSRSLVLADTYAGWTGSFPPDVVAKRLETSLSDLELPPDQVAMKWLPGFVTQSALQAIQAELRTIIADFDPDGMRPMVRALAEADLWDSLKRIAVPTLLVWGDQDVRSPLTVAENLHAQIAGSRLVVIEGAGHLSHVEAPDRFNAELRRFLSD